MLLRNSASVYAHALDYIFFNAKYICPSQQSVTEVGCTCQVAREITFLGAFQNSAITVVMSVRLQADYTKFGTINFQQMVLRTLVEAAESLQYNRTVDLHFVRL